MGLYVDDVEAHRARARSVGAAILHEPTTTDHGAEYWIDRSYEVEGHRWWFCQRLSDPQRPPPGKRVVPV